MCPDLLFHYSKLLKCSSWRAADTGPSGDFFFSIHAAFQLGKYSICSDITSVKPSCPLNAPNTPSPICPILHCLPSICHWDLVCVLPAPKYITPWGHGPALQLSWFIWDTWPDMSMVVPSQKSAGNMSELLRVHTCTHCSGVDPTQVMSYLHHCPVTQLGR